MSWKPEELYQYQTGVSKSQIRPHGIKVWKHICPSALYSHQFNINEVPLASVDGSCLTEAAVTGDAKGICLAWPHSLCVGGTQRCPPLPCWVTVSHLLCQEAPAHLLGLEHGHEGSLHPWVPRSSMGPRCSDPSPWHCPHFHTFPCESDSSACSYPISLPG